MKRILRALAAIALIATLTGCLEETPITGTVMKRTHTPATVEYQYDNGCGLNMDGTYTCGEPKYRLVTVPDKWVLAVEDANGDEHLISVSADTYRTHPAGSTYSNIGS